MGIFKRAHVRGMVHELTRQGIVSWPSKYAEEEAADAIADAAEESEIPEVSGEQGLSPEQAKEVLDHIVDVAQIINQHAEAGGGTAGAAEGAEGMAGPEMDEAIKESSARLSYEDAAAVSVYTLMRKVAEETSVSGGPMVPGQTPPKPEIGTTVEGEIDAKDYPSSEYTGPQGETRFDTRAGAVGQEIKRDVQPGAQESSPDNGPSKLAAILANLGKSAMDGASLSGGAAGGPTPAARKDLPDNLNIPGAVASRMGVSAMKVPANANVGELRSQPAGEPGASAPVSNQLTADVTKQAMDILMSTAEGREQLRKMGSALNMAL
jgi:hypothetical protein